MSDYRTTKIPCIVCGVPILRDTAVDTGGLCMPCFHGCDRNSNPTWHYRRSGLIVAVMGIVLMLLSGSISIAVARHFWSIGLLVLMGKVFLFGILGLFGGTYLLITGRGK